MTVDENKPITHLLQDARQEGIRQGKIVATAAALHMLVKNLKLTPQEAVVLLEINRKERKTYLKILANEAKRREERKKKILDA